MTKSSVELDRRVFLKVSTAAVVGVAVSGCGGRMPATSQPVSTGPTVHEFDFTTDAFAGFPDGREKELWGYNGEFPGPEIRVTEGDTIRVRVNNHLPDPTSIHWHGMKQRGTWTMDGVTPVSRPPIEPGQSFVYEFRAEPAGTHWYHSHTGVQYSEGLYGPLIIESQERQYEYDREQVLMIGDWFVENSDVVLENVKNGTYRAAETPTTGTPTPDYGDVPFESFLFNGKGRLPETTGDLTSIAVRQGEVIRFRIINTSSTYMFKLQFDHHDFTIVETDGQPVSPVEADSLVVDIGERFDVLLTARHSGAHFIRVATMDNKQGLAVLRYDDDEASTPDQDVTWGARTISSADLRAPEPVNLPADGHRSVELEFSGNMNPYAWSINGVQYPEGDPIRISEGESIRVVMRNPTRMSHPFHLHGHYFRVLGRPGELNLLNPPLKDSVTVPAQDAVVIQFDADNPGKWFFHCHIEWHAAVGMAMVIEYEDV